MEPAVIALKILGTIFILMGVVKEWFSWQEWAAFESKWWVGALIWWVFWSIVLAAVWIG